MFEKLIKEINAIDPDLNVKEELLDGEYVLYVVKDAFRVGVRPTKACFGDEKNAAVSIANVIRAQLPIADKTSSTCRTIMNWDMAKEHLQLCLREPNLNDARTVTRKFLDIEQYVRIMLPGDSTCDYSTAVTYQLCDLWNVSPAEVFANAKIPDPVALSFGDVAALAHAPAPENENALDDELVLILTVENRLYGASVVMAHEFMAKIGARFGRSCVLLPASVNEWIALPEPDERGDLGALKRMVSDVNQVVVKPDERLSDSVYRYEVGKGLSLVM